MKQRLNVAILAGDDSPHEKAKMASPMVGLDIQDFVGVAAQQLSEKVIRDFRRGKSKAEIRKRHKIECVEHVDCDGSTRKGAGLQVLTNS